MRRRKFWKRELNTNRSRKKWMKTRRKRNHLRDNRSPRLKRHSIKKERKEELTLNLSDLRRRLQLQPKKAMKKVVPRVHDLRVNLRHPLKMQMNRRKRRR